MTDTTGVVLYEEPLIPGEVLVAGFTDTLFNSTRTGAATGIPSASIISAPTVSGSINDLTRFTPQAHGTSFAGRDNRFNNYTVNGLIYNDNFGTGSAQLAGMDPLSLEVIEEIQVNIARYDVRQGGFTGASVNMITKRGENRFRGGTYAFYRDASCRDQPLENRGYTQPGTFNRILGASAGGPIISDRLFFFLGIEHESGTWPGLQKAASRPGLPGDGLTVSRVPARELEFVK
jgi:hypothetical protein